MFHGSTAGVDRESVVASSMAQGETSDGGADSQTELTAAFLGVLLPITVTGYTGYYRAGGRYAWEKIEREKI